MSKTTAALAAVLLLATCQVPLRNAEGQTSVHVKTVKTITLEQLQGIDPNRPKDIMTTGPQINRVNAPGEHLPDIPDKKTILIVGDYGGVIAQYEERWQAVRIRGDEVAVVGACQSACTTLLGIVPKPLICFGPTAALAFHSARETASNLPAPTANRRMFERFPPEIQGWLVAKGGWERFPLQGYWTLPAAELYQMGYRRCPT